MRDPAWVEELAAREAKQAREAVERGRQVWGLLWLALLSILFGVWRAGLGRVFAVGWWRLW